MLLRALAAVPPAAGVALGLTCKWAECQGVEREKRSTPHEAHRGFNSVEYDFRSPQGVKVVTTPMLCKAKEGHVLVNVRACGVNPVDAKYCWGDKLPEFIPENWKRRLVQGAGTGFDFAGEVKDSGDSRFKEGDVVFGTMPPLQASFAEVVEAPAHQVAKSPKSLELAEAAALPLVGVTAMQALRHTFGLREGQRILIVGASGGVGSVATPLAKYIVGKTGHVAAVCSTRNTDMVRGLGADAVYDYSNGLPELMEELKRQYPEDGHFDLVLDCVSSLEAKDRKFDYNSRIHAGKLLKRELNAPETSKSNYITIGGSFWDWIRANLRRRYGWNWYGKHHELFWISFPHSAPVLEEISAAADCGALKPIIEQVPVSRFTSVEPVAQAFQRLHERRVQGKLVLVL